MSPAASTAIRRGSPAGVPASTCEVSAGHWEGASDHASHTAFLDLAFSWPTAPATRVPDGESRLEVLERFDGVVNEAVQSGAEAVRMVSRGVAIRAWLAARARNVTTDDVKRRELDNTGVVIADRR
ncbi:histidine phosphatase family protein [Streptomyces mirabilis]